MTEGVIPGLQGLMMYCMQSCAALNRVALRALRGNRTLPGRTRGPTETDYASERAFFDLPRTWRGIDAQTSRLQCLARSTPEVFAHSRTSSVHV